MTVQRKVALKEDAIVGNEVAPLLYSVHIQHTARCRKSSSNLLHNKQNKASAKMLPFVETSCTRAAKAVKLAVGSKQTSPTSLGSSAGQESDCGRHFRWNAALAQCCLLP